MFQFYYDSYCFKFFILGGFEKFQGNKLNEGEISNFYKHFIYKNFVMNFKTYGFVGFADDFVI